MRVLYIEPFAAGSHAAFGRTLRQGLGDDVTWTELTLPGRHWKWRMRGAAAYFAHAHADTLRDAASRYDVLVASSYLALAELRGFVPGLHAVPAVLYFHENQFAYPTRAPSETPGRAPAAANDQDYGFAQMIAALSAQALVFNSEYNRSTFLGGAEALLGRLPDAKVPGWVERLRDKSEVLGLPLALPAVDAATLCDGEVGAEERALGPVLLWNHRWEHDKRPELFFAALRVLMARGVAFRVAVCGERYRTAPPVFEHARAWLGEGRIAHWGYLAERADYEALLGRAHVAVSTSAHEFFGVSMLEATHLGCHPLVPDALCYPELFPAVHRYASHAELHAQLEALCVGWAGGAVSLRADRRAWTSPHAAARRLGCYRALLERVVAASGPAR